MTIVSGETDAPVPGARVIVAGAPQLTDSNGQVSVPAAAEGATVDVEAAGFLTRQTLVRYATTRLTLWPEGPQLPESYTMKLVYTASSSVDSSSLVPLDRLPPKVRTLSLEPSDALKADEQAMAAHEGAAEGWNAAAQGRTVFSVGGTADMKVPTRVDPTDASCDDPWTVLVRVWVSSHEVTRAEIVFCGSNPSRLAMPILHEMGHIYGLGHSSEHRDVMFPYYSTHTERGFTEPEVLTMALISQRRGGNVWPDNDRTAASSAAYVRVFVN